MTKSELIGKKVFHKTFGNGIIIAVSTPLYLSSHWKLKVRFDNSNNTAMYFKYPLDFDNGILQFDNNASKTQQKREPNDIISSSSGPSANEGRTPEFDKLPLDAIMYILSATEEIKEAQKNAITVEIQGYQAKFYKDYMGETEFNNIDVYYQQTHLVHYTVVNEYNESELKDFLMDFVKNR